MPPSTPTTTSKTQPSTDYVHTEVCTRAGTLGVTAHAACSESDECSTYAPLKFLLSNIEKSASDIDPPLPTVSINVHTYPGTVKGSVCNSYLPWYSSRQCKIFPIPASSLCTLNLYIQERTIVSNPACIASFTLAFGSGLQTTTTKR